MLAAAAASHAGGQGLETKKTFNSTKQMEKYVEKELAKRLNQNNSDNNKDDSDDEEAVPVDMEEFMRLQKQREKEDMMAGTMLSSIPEVDLGLE